MKVLYTAEAISTGEGRNGHVRTSDGMIDMNLTMPKELGGTGTGVNPEQLFAAGYAACFHSALKMIAGNEKVNVSDSTVTAKASIGPNDKGGFELAVELHVAIPSVSDAQARELAEKAHQVCPYSNATRNNISVELSVSGA